MKNIYKVCAVVGGLMTTGAVCAQSTGNVTIYGSIDTGIATTSNGLTRTISEDQGLLVTNRLGFTGKEDLGGGLSAQFLVEMGFFSDTGALDNTNNALFNRQSWVGLNSNYGNVKLGRIKTLLYQYDYEYLDAMNNALAGASFRLFNFFGNRTSNTVEYADAANGFKWALQHSMGEVAGNNKASSMNAGMLAYNRGPAEFIIVNHKAYDVTGNDSAKATTFGGNYDFGTFRVYGAYAINKGAGALDTRDSSVGVNMPLGPGKIMLSYVHKTDRAVVNGNANLLGIGYTYSLSKRTTLYTSAARLANSSNASYMAGAKGLTWNTVNAGIQHSF